MKNSAALFSTLLLAGILLLNSCDNKNKASSATLATSSTDTKNTSAAGGMRIAYVDIDSLEANYTYLKNKKDEFKKKQDQMDAELQRSYQQMQNDIADVQKKAQANTLSQPEYEAAQKRLGQMQQSLETRKQSMSAELIQAQDDFNKDLKTRLDNFLADYNKDKGYDYILSYGGTASGILYANKKLDITRDVIKGMNTSVNNTGNKK